MTAPDGEIGRREFGGETRGTASFEVDIEEARSWVAVTVEDGAGKMAYSDPIWINTITAEDILVAE